MISTFDQLDGMRRRAECEPDERTRRNLLRRIDRLERQLAELEQREAQLRVPERIYVLRDQEGV